MSQLIQTYIAICLIRANPQDLPASSFLSALSISCYWVGSLLLAMVSFTFSRALFFASVDTGLLLGLAGLLLWIRNLGSRYGQTVSALTGAGALLSFVGWPVLLWEHRVANELNVAMLPAMLLLVLMIWNIAVIGHILRHALSTTIAFGAALSVFYMFVSLNVLRVLFFSAS